MGKARAEYTVSDMKRLDLSFLKKDATEEAVTKMRDNIKYISNIANAMGHDTVGNKPFLTLFGDKPFNEYDKGEINKILVGSLNYDKALLSLSVEGQSQLALLESDIANHHYDGNTKQDIENEMQKIEDRISSRTNSLEEYSRMMNSVLLEINNLDRENEELEDKLANVGDDVINYTRVEGIKKVIEKGDWLYLGREDCRISIKGSTYRTQRRPRSSHLAISSNEMMFLSSKPIVCSYVNNAANVSMAVDFGHLLIAMNQDGSIHKAKFVINFMENSEIQHPHLSSHSICWGSAQSRYHRLTGSSAKYDEILTLLKALLETYEPSNPYRTLKHFQIRRNHRHLSALPPHLLDRVPDALLTPEVVEYKQSATSRAKNYDAFVSSLDYVEASPLAITTTELIKRKYEEYCTFLSGIEEPCERLDMVMNKLDSDDELFITKEMFESLFSVRLGYYFGQSQKGFLILVLAKSGITEYWQWCRNSTNDIRVVSTAADRISGSIFKYVKTNYTRFCSEALEDHSFALTDYDVCTEQAAGYMDMIIKPMEL